MAVWPALGKMLARHEIVIGPQNQLSNRICPNWNHWLWVSFNSFSHHPIWPVSSKISKQTVFFHILRICSINLGTISRSYLCELHTHIIHVAGFVFREKLGEVIPGDQKKRDPVEGEPHRNVAAQLVLSLKFTSLYLISSIKYIYKSFLNKRRTSRNKIKYRHTHTSQLTHAHVIRSGSLGKLSQTVFLKLLWYMAPQYPLFKCWFQFKRSAKRGLLRSLPS